MVRGQTGRALVGIATAAAFTTMAPTTVWSQKRKQQLPDCAVTEIFGSWRAHLLIVEGSFIGEVHLKEMRELGSVGLHKDASVLRGKAVEFKYYDGGTYHIVLRLKQATSSKDWTVAVSAPDSTVRRANLTPKEESQHPDFVVVNLDASRLFDEPDNPLAQERGVVKIELTNGSTRVALSAFEPHGFAQAREFVRSHRPRLEALLKRRQCDDSRRE